MCSYKNSIRDPWPMKYFSPASTVMGKGRAVRVGEDSMGVRTDRLGKIKYVLLVGVSY